MLGSIGLSNNYVGVMYGYVRLCLGIGKSYVGLYRGYEHYVGQGKVYVIAT